MILNSWWDQPLTTNQHKWGRRRRLQQTTSCAIKKIEGVAIAKTLCRFWCHRLQFFYNIFKEEARDGKYTFTQEDCHNYIEHFLLQNCLMDARRFSRRRAWACLCVSIVVPSYKDKKWISPFGSWKRLGASWDPIFVCQHYFAPPLVPTCAPRRARNTWFFSRFVPATVCPKCPEKNAF